MQGYKDIIVYQTFDKKLFHAESEAKEYIKDCICEIFDNNISKDSILSIKERNKVIESLAERHKEIYLELYKIFGEI